MVSIGIMDTFLRVSQTLRRFLVKVHHVFSCQIIEQITLQLDIRIIKRYETILVLDVSKIERIIIIHQMSYRVVLRQKVCQIFKLNLRRTHAYRGLTNAIL